MFYMPRLPDGRLVALPWQIRLFFLNGNWPLSNYATRSQNFLNKIQLTVVFLVVIFITEAEFNLIIQNWHNKSLVLEALPTALVCTELILRIYDMAFKRNDFEMMIKNFYAEIYFERSKENRKLYDDIQSMSRPTRINVYTYFGTLFAALATPIFGFFNQKKLFPVPMQTHYDHNVWLFYMPTLLFASLACFISVLQQAAEATMLVSLMLHLNGRYLLLQSDLSNLYEKCKKTLTAETVSDSMTLKFHIGFSQILQRNSKLNRFASEMQQQYSFRIFVMMSLSALLVCVLGLKVLRTGMNVEAVTYVLWIFTKIMELIVFGRVGSALIETTGRMSLAYYASNWEHVIEHSNNIDSNKALMKTVVVAIELNRKAIYFSGFGFFTVSLPTAALILRGAGSYFTSLYTLQ